MNNWVVVIFDKWCVGTIEKIENTEILVKIVRGEGKQMSRSKVPNIQILNKSQILGKIEEPRQEKKGSIQFLSSMIESIPKYAKWFRDVTPVFRLIK